MNLISGVRAWCLMTHSLEVRKRVTHNLRVGTDISCCLNLVTNVLRARRKVIRDMSRTALVIRKLTLDFRVKET